MKIDLFINERTSLNNHTVAENVNIIEVAVDDGFESKKSLELISNKAFSEYSFIYFGNQKISLTSSDVYRFISVAEETGAGLIYSDFFMESAEEVEVVALSNYQLGSVRDDFDFGRLVLIKQSLLKDYLSYEKEEYRFSSFYAFRLFVAERSEVFHIPETLYLTEEMSLEKSGDKLFNYLKEEETLIQKEREKVFTDYLKRTGAFIGKTLREISFNELQFNYVASVIIPVKDRVRTISDAVKSALSQQTDFPFNVIVVDNHSTDGTSDVLEKIKEQNKNLFIVKPREKYHGIGGCWNLAIAQSYCGMFSVQLDSDDIYSDNSTLMNIVTKFYETKAAAVVGSYKLTDFNLNELPPGVIAHNEWSENNGRNNALRINGFGAPRAFYTPVIRETKFPDVSYGEDYSVMLAISRYYKIARIYNPIYICRRWEGNSDSNISYEKEKKHNEYKDFIRTLEIKARINLNRRLS